MRDSFVVIFRRLLAVALFALTLNVEPLPAQESGDGPTFYTGNYTTKFARYYAPYALQAAGAYLPVSSLDETLKLPRGDDVTRVIGYAINETALVEKATKYLRAWQYQFGSEKYLNCFEDDPDCLKANQDRFRVPLSVGPAFHVWARTGHPGRTGSACSEVSIAFRGTDNATWARWGTDWATNADSLIGWGTDNSYRQLRRNIDAILKKITTLPCYRTGNRPQIVSVGHSLGAGLGQLAALANSPENKRRGLGITKVFAFDASPLTGSSYVTGAIQKANANVEVDLVYQNLEVLAALRGKASSPCLRTMRFDALQGAGPLGLHNMAALSREMVRMTYDTEDGGQMNYRRPKPLPNCKTLYVTPATDVDPDPAAAPQSPLMSGPGAPVARVTSADRDRAMNSFAMSGGSGFASAPVTEMVGSVASAPAKKPDAPRSKRAGGLQAPVLQAAFDAAWPPG